MSDIKSVDGLIYGQGEMENIPNGGHRESNKGRGRFDLIPYEAIEALAILFEKGADKYGERNWEDGVPVSRCINSMCRHAMKAASGMTDEDHLAAVMWNAAVAITMIKRRPDMNDHSWQDIHTEDDLKGLDVDGDSVEEI